MKMPINRDKLLHLLSVLTADDQAWLRQQLLGWQTQTKLHETAHLHLQELLALESWFWEHYCEARTMREKMPRLRNWCIFMLLRYGALLPHEIFSLTLADMDWQYNQIHIHSQENPRTVPLPPQISRRMQKACVDMLSAENAYFLRCDDGFMRRSLQQGAKACGLPNGLVNARSLRRHRAQELLQQGIPLPVVDIFLGRTSNASNTIMRYNMEAAMNLLREHMQADRPMKSSARNIFQGRIIELQSSGILVRVTLVTAGGLRVTSFITDVSRQRLKLEVGKLVNASVKAPWVVVAQPDTQETDCAESWPENTYLAEVEQVRDDGMVMEVLAKLQEGSQICAIEHILDKKQAHLNVGDKVRISFKAFAVILTI